jgi:phosphatidylserine/phosphatidylglycerophosphate/cardiolipin synthase-like enzyme
LSTIAESIVTLAQKIWAIFAECYVRLASIVIFPFRFIGAKGFSICGVIFRLPIVAFKHLACLNELGHTFRDDLFMDKGYHRFDPHHLTGNEAKHYLLHASAARAIQEKDPKWILPYGYTLIESGVFGSGTGFQFGLYRKENELLIAIDAIEEQVDFQGAEEEIKKIREILLFKEMKITLTGQSLGGSLAQYVALQQQIPAICLNSLPLGPGLQWEIGDQKLQKADDYVTHVGVEGDLSSTDSSAFGIADFALNLLGIRTAGNFGKKYLVPSIYQTAQDTHRYILGSLFAQWKPKYASLCTKDEFAEVLNHKIKKQIEVKKIDLKAKPDPAKTASEPSLWDHVCTVAYAIYAFFRKLLLFPLVCLHSIIKGAKIRFFQLGLTDLAGDSATYDQKVQAEKLTVLDTSEASLKWKMALIKNAQHSIEISGCYCGGKIFREALDVIEQRIWENPDFKARIITSTYTLEEKDREEIQRLTELYPNNFETLIIPEGVWTLHPKLMRHENHSKMIIADQTWCIAGGTSLNSQLLPHGQVTEAGGPFAFLCDGAADVDMAAKGEMAQGMKQQFDLLWTKWKRLCNTPENPFLDRGLDVFYFVGKKVITLPPEMEGEGLQETIDCRLILSGPEQGQNNFSLRKMVKMIDGAKKEIHIANMSLNQKTVIQALKRAIERGVQVKVVTNGHFTNSSFSSKILSARSRLNYKKLWDAAQYSKNGGSFCVWEYNKDNILFHPKIMTVDGEKTVVGSFNIVRDSSRCNDESTLFMKSPKIAERLKATWNTFQQDSVQILEENVRSFCFQFGLVKGFILDAFLKDISD